MQWVPYLSDNGTEGAALVPVRTVAKRNTVARLYCHWLVENMPTKGLREMMESLLSIYEFNMQQAPATDHVLLSAPTQVKGRIGLTIVRPEFPVSDEE